LRGRLHECEVLDRLLEAVRGGESGALVVRGEPGVGKSALLEYLAGRALSAFPALIPWMGTLLGTGSVLQANMR
jgi:ABC-type molybdenum transport system ATPase subunit/photorepair protein PhrA